MTTDGHSYLMKWTRAIIEAQAAVHQWSATVDFLEKKRKLYPVTVNDEGVCNHGKSMGGGLFGEANVLLSLLVMGAEDFSFYIQRMSGARFNIGIRNESFRSVHDLRSPYFFVDEEALPRGAAFHAAVPLAYLDFRSFVGIVDVNNTDTDDGCYMLLNSLNVHH